MAYSSYFPATYQSPAINPYLLQMQAQPQMQQLAQMQQAAQAQQPQPQIQNGGLVSVRSRAEAQNYPVAPGNSVTFKDETAPFVYTKTMGFSQLDRPVFEIFRLVREEEPLNQPEIAENKPIKAQAADLSIYATKEEIAPIFARIEALEAASAPKKAKKKEEASDE